MSVDARGTTKRPVFRFAPSPNGLLHLGHALSALTGFEAARRAGGRFLLRIEDIDVARARPEFVDAIFRDLAWLGVTWEEPVLVQSAHFSDYLEAADILRDRGLLYPCFASRAEIAAAVPGGPWDPHGMPLYPGLWKGRAQAEVAAALACAAPHVLRLDMELALADAGRRLGGRPLMFTEIDSQGRSRAVTVDARRWGDVVIVRREFPASYHLAVVVDDARQGVTHVTRGQDLFAATDLQRLLQVLLGLPEPVYHHHRLIVAGDGHKLSKSVGDTSLASLRAEGASPHDIRRLVGLE